MILFLRTDSPICLLTLQQDDGNRVEAVWQADRQLAKGLLRHIEDFLGDNDANWNDLSGLVVFQGPGSFTGLRIGITVMNTVAYAQSIPVVGAVGEQWQDEGVARLEAGEDDRIVVPEYGREARITKPRK